MTVHWLDQGIGTGARPVPVPSVDIIIRVVCDEFAVSRNEVVSARRNKASVRARHAAMWLTRRLTKLSYPQIGQRFGDRDHTTIIHGCEQTDIRMRADPALAERMVLLMDSLACAGTAQ